MRFNFAQALAILAITNPIAALQSPDYADNLAVVARDATPEAAPALLVDEEAPIQARDPARRGKPGRSGGRLGRLRDAAEIGSHASDIIRNGHEMIQNGQQQKRDLEARDPRRRGKPGRGSGRGRDTVGIVSDLTNIAANAHQMAQGGQQPQQKRDLEARDPRRRGKPGRGSGRGRDTVGIVSDLTNIAVNAHQIAQNGQQPQQKRDLEARDPRRRGKPGRGSGRGRDTVGIVSDLTNIAVNAHQMAQGGQQPQQKRDLEARDPARRSKPGKPGRSGGRLERLRDAAEVGSHVSDIVRNGHQMIQNGQQQKRDLEARDPARRGKPGKSGRGRLGRIGDAAEIGSHVSDIIRNGHEMIQNGQQTA